MDTLGRLRPIIGGGISGLPQPLKGVELKTITKASKGLVNCNVNFDRTLYPSLLGYSSPMLIVVSGNIVYFAGDDHDVVRLA